MTKSKGIQKPRHRWTEEQIAILQSRYANERTALLAAEIGCALHVLYKMATKLQLKKSEEFLQSTDSGRIKKLTSVGAQYRFPKGHEPANKGKKMPGFAAGRMAETQYAKGNVPPNYLPLGSERYSKEGYLQRKMTDTGYPPKDWVPVHWLLWIQHNGPIPAGHRVCFKDRNKQNIVIGNLELLTVAEMMKRNSRHNYPSEINEVIYARANLTRQINKRLKNERTENDK